MVAGPLAGLLLLGGLRSWRERWWLAAAAAVAVMSFTMGQSSPAGDLVRAAGLVFTGALVGLVAWDRSSGALGHAVRAAGVATAATVTIAAATGQSWTVLRVSLEAQIRAAAGLVLDTTAMAPAQQAAIDASVVWMARLFPGIALVCTVLGGVLALAVAHRVSARPVGPAPGPFAGFRFNDHLVWGVVVTLALALAPLPAAGSDLVANLLVGWAGLYGFRGFAVWTMAMRRWNPFLRFALFLSAVLLLPYAMGAALLLGLADTWLDFRRAHTPPATGGSSDD